MSSEFTPVVTILTSLTSFSMSLFINDQGSVQLIAAITVLPSSLAKSRFLVNYITPSYDSSMWFMISWIAIICNIMLFPFVLQYIMSLSWPALHMQHLCCMVKGYHKNRRLCNGDNGFFRRKLEITGEIF